MKKKIKLEITEAQFLAILDVANTIESEIGTGEEFAKEQNKNLRLIDRALKKNGYKRK